VGIDNRRAGFMITEHLLKLGCRRIGFIAYPHSATTVDSRIAGYREALLTFGVAPDPMMIHRLDPESIETVQSALRIMQPEAVVCANDRTAGYSMRTALKLGYRVPEDLRIAGIDDVRYATLLPVPLTTIHQPCREIGEVAMAAMVERVSRRDMPSREILLASALVVRDST
jgi:DNA-binding LacI/PurR family transcriptional regulator